MNGPLRVPPGCGERGKTAALVELRLSGALDVADERLLRSHLVACPACFEEAVAADPTLLFARLAASAEAGEAAGRGARRGGRPAGEEELEANVLAADVLAALRVRAAEEGRHRTGRVPPEVRPWLKAAAVVALASGVAATLLLRRPPAPVAAPLPPAAAEAWALPPIEEVGSPGARVYQFAGSGQGEPTVVFVANPNADL